MNLFIIVVLVLALSVQVHSFHLDADTPIECKRKVCSVVPEPCGEVHGVTAECSSLSGCSKSRTDKEGVCVALPKEGETCSSRASLRCTDGAQCTPTDRTSHSHHHGYKHLDSFQNMFHMMWENQHIPPDDGICKGYGNYLEAPGLPGDTCNTDSDCKYKKKCLDGRCDFSPLGGTCKPSHISRDCIKGTICGLNGTCIVGMPNGALCENNIKGINECQSRQCDSNICQDIGSQSLGERCVATPYCKEGLFCPMMEPRLGKIHSHNWVANKTCIKPQNTATLHKPCTVHSDCTMENYEECKCTPFGTSICAFYEDTNPIGYAPLKKEFQECALQHGCITLSSGKNTILFSSCLIHNCTSQTCDRILLENGLREFECMLPYCPSALGVPSFSNFTNDRSLYESGSNFPKKFIFGVLAIGVALYFFKSR